MAVGVSYNGFGGNRKMSLSGIPTGEDAFLLGPSRKKAKLPESFRRALSPQPEDPVALDKEGKVKLNAYDRNPGTLADKTMPGSAVTTSPFGLCLEGEQGNPVIVGKKLYSSLDGQKGYHSMDEIDPPVSAGRVGPLGAGGEGADDSVARAGTPFAYQVVSRIVMETDLFGRKFLIEYDKDVEETSLGRTSTVTGERRRVIGFIDGDKSAGFLHPYEVRWKAPTESTSGEWVIWLPSGGLLMYGTSYVDVRANLSAAGKPFLSGWYSLKDKFSAGTGSIYLNLTKSGSEGDVSVEVAFSGEPSGDVSVLVCDVATNEQTKEVVIRQSVVSAVFLADAEGSVGEDGVGIESIESGTAYQSGEYTNTPVTVTLTDGTAEEFVVVAKNGADGAPGVPGAPGATGADGADGEDGEDGVGIESIEAGTAYPSDDGEYTKTPITVTLTNGVSEEFVVSAKNGSNAEISGTEERFGDIRYDTESHQLQKRIDTINLATGQVTEGPWVMITGGQAVSHSSTITG